MWPGSNGAITRRILHIVSAEKQRAKESGVVGITAKSQQVFHKGTSPKVGKNPLIVIINTWGVMPALGNTRCVIKITDSL